MRGLETDFVVDRRGSLAVGATEDDFLEQGLDDITAARAQISSARHLYVGSESLEKRIGDAFSRTEHWDWAIDTYRKEGYKRGELLFFDGLARAYLADGRL